MAERVVVVCDVCGKSPAETVGITANDKNYRKDLCAEHMAELLKSARAPSRGRPRGTRAAAAQAPAAGAPRRRGRPPKAAAAAAAPAPKRERRKITDPVILEKRRAALAKARQARADKRAAAKNAG
jgi:hypothetical protein